jgi:transporter family protein
MWKFYAILSALFAAFTAILAKVGVKGISGNLATAIRTVIVLFMAWGIVLLSGELGNVKEISKRNLIFLIASGVATGLSWIFYFKALETGPVSKVAPIDKLSIVFVILFSLILLKEPFDFKLLIGAGLIVAGTFVLIW